MRQLDDSLAPDDELAERAARGSGAAFALLVSRHGHAVYTIARNMCATSGEAEEVLQQAFLAAWREIRFLPAGAKFTPWLYGIAMKAAFAQRRRDGRSPSRSLEPYLPAFDGAGRLAASERRRRQLDGNPSQSKVTGLLREALEYVDDQTRAVFVLRDVLQLPADETAAILEASPEAVRRDAHRLRLMLRGFLDQL